jgi:hypothetical protein
METVKSRSIAGIRSAGFATLPMTPSEETIFRWL